MPSLWDGHGAVRLLASDAGTCAMLLERLDAGRSLQTCRWTTAVEVWGGLVRQLSLVPDERPQWREFDHGPRGPNSGAMTCPRMGTAGAAFPAVAAGGRA